MTIVQELEKVITQLPLKKAIDLNYWLDEYKASQRYKQVKAYTQAVQTLAEFKKNKNNSSWN